MLGYALNDQISYENNLIGIFVLIPILKNYFLRIVINTAINLQCVFVVLGKSNYNVANFSRSPSSMPASTIESPAASRI